MIRLSALITVALLMTATLQAQVREGAELAVLDGSAGMQTIFLNTNVATTVTFPGKISLVTGYGLVQDMGGILNFQATSTISVIHYQRVAADTIVLRMLRSGMPCFMTIRTTEGLFLLKGVGGEEANLAVMVNLGDPAQRSVEIPAESVAEQRIDYEPMALVGILSRAQQRAFLESVNPELFEGWEERNDLELESTSRGASIKIYQIQRWPAKDALVLRSMVTNPTNRPFIYDPKAVEVRVGNRVYPVQLADGAGQIPPGKRVTLDVVLVGNPLGGKEHIAISNDFRIELPAGGSLPSSTAVNSTSSALFPQDQVEAEPLFGPKSPVIDAP